MPKTMKPNPTATPKAASQIRAWNRAEALGYAHPDRPNPHPHGSYCWISWERGRARRAASSSS